MANGRLKIGISCYPTYGGSGIVATELGKCLAERGHEVHFITYAMPMRLASFREKVYFHEVDTPEYPLFEYAPYSLALASVMSEVAEEHKLDLIHAHYAIPHAASAYLARQILNGKLKVVTTLHGTDISLVGNQPAYLPVVKFTIEQSDAVTAVSKWLADETRKVIGCCKPISVIPNFIDAALFNRAPEIRLRRKLAMDSQPIIMHISNFRSVKRTEDLIRVLKIVKEQIDAVMVLVGDGPSRIKVEKLCRQLNLCGNTIFLGKQLDIFELLSQADVYLSTSESESFGLSALEAMSCGVPVVATKVGGVPEVISDGDDGFLCAVGDVECMAKRILELLTDVQLHRNISISGRHKVEKEFSCEKIVNMYEDLYFRTVEG